MVTRIDGNSKMRKAFDGFVDLLEVGDFPTGILDRNTTYFGYNQTKGWTGGAARRGQWREVCKNLGLKGEPLHNDNSVGLHVKWNVYWKVMRK